MGPSTVERQVHVGRGLSCVCLTEFNSQPMLSSVAVRHRQTGSQSRGTRGVQVPAGAVDSATWLPARVLSFAPEQKLDTLALGTPRIQHSKDWSRGTLQLGSHGLILPENYPFTPIQKCKGWRPYLRVIRDSVQNFKAFFLKKKGGGERGERKQIQGLNIFPRHLF